jgi:hypothetical protein
VKTCPRRAEKVQPAAAVCRFCSYEFTAEETRSAKIEDGLNRAAKLLPGLLLAGFVLWTCSGVQKEMAADRQAEVADAQASVQDPKPCAKLLSKARRARLIRAWRRGDEIQVDEEAWAELPADAKRGVMLSLRCRALDGRADTGTLPMIVVAYGYRSGRELASATRYGVDLK